MKTEDKLNSVKKDYDDTKSRINELEELKKTLEKKEAVIKYLLVIKELAELKNKEKKLVDETQNLKINLCHEKYGGHFYVADRQQSKGCWPKETMVTCIHCGMRTNIREYLILESDDRDFRDLITEKILIDIRGVYVDDELDELKSLYDEAKEKYSGASDEEISKYIKLIKGMKKGSLC